MGGISHPTCLRASPGSKPCSVLRMTTFNGGVSPRPREAQALPSQLLPIHLLCPYSGLTSRSVQLAAACGLAST